MSDNTSRINNHRFELSKVFFPYAGTDLADYQFDLLGVNENIFNSTSLLSNGQAKLLNDKQKDYINSKTKKFSKLAIVNYGTGTGKSYGSIEQYLQFILATYNKSTKKNSKTDLRLPAGVNFTNCVFTSSNKSHLKIDESQIKKLSDAGVTLVSFLSQSDLLRSNTKMWGTYHSTLNRNPTTISEKINDLISSVVILKGYMFSAHHNAQLKKIDKALRYIKENQETYERLIAKINQLTAEKKNLTLLRNEIAALEAEIARCRGAYFDTINRLTKTILSNDCLIRKGSNDVYIDNEKEIDDFRYMVDAENDTVVKITNERWRSKTIDGESNKNFYDENDVVNQIFDKAIDKEYFDHPILNLIKSDKYSHTAKLATLKKEYLRIFSPIDYCLYTPCLILLTHAKMLVGNSMYRVKEKDNGMQEWVANSYGTMFEFIGNKESYNKSIPYVKGKEHQTKYLKETIYKPKKMIGDNPFGESNDEISSAMQLPCNFMVFIDECNLLFDNLFSVSESNGIKKQGVIKRVLQDMSIVDLISSAGSKISSHLENLSLDEHNRSFYVEYKSFYDCIHHFFFENSGVSRDEFDLDSVFISYISKNELIHIDHTDIDSVINIIKNSYSSCTKSFINKDELKSIYINNYGSVLKISNKIDPKALGSGITMYHYYYMILSVLYACHQYSKVASRLSGISNTKIREAFSRMVGTYDSGDDQRTSYQLSNLLKDTKLSARYIDYLRADAEPTDENIGGFDDFDEDQFLDVWFASIQSLLIFNLKPNTTFDGINYPEFEGKTYYDIELFLRLYDPEFEVLKALVNTNNTMYLMSATSGKERMFAGQFNLELLAEYCEDFNIQITSPIQSDEFWDRNYSEIYKSLKAIYLKQRKVDFVILPDEVGSINAISTAIAQQLDGDFDQKKIKKLYENLLAISNKSRDANYPTLSAYPKGFYEQCLFSLASFMTLNESALIVTDNSSLTQDLIKSINDEINYEKIESWVDILYSLVDSPNFNWRHNIQSKTKDLTISFIKASAGRFVLPLILDRICEYILDFKRDANKQGVVWTDYITKKIINDLRQKESGLNQVIDFIDVVKDKTTGDDFVYRVVVLDNNLNQSEKLADYLICDKTYGVKMTTGVLTYTASIKVGTNLLLNDRLTNTKRDIKNLYMAGYPFYTIFNERDDDKLSSALKDIFALRYLSHNSTLIKAKELDKKLRSSEVVWEGYKTHGFLVIDALKQLLGRLERKILDNDETRIFINESAIKICQQSFLDLYYQDKDLNEVSSNFLDYEFLSLNSSKLHDIAISNLKNNVLSDDMRHALRKDTQQAAESIKSFCDNYGNNIIHQIRLFKDAEKLNDEQSIALKDLIDFDGCYRHKDIALNPERWRDNLLATDYCNKNPQVKQVVSTFVIDMCHYKPDFDINPIGIYVNENTLTDCLGERTHYKACNQEYFFVENIQQRVDLLEGVSISKENDNLYFFLLKYKKFISLYNSYAKLHFGQYILHPVLMHMAKGNLVEFLFEQLRDVFSRQDAYRDTLQDNCFTRYTNDSFLGTKNLIYKTRNNQGAIDFSLYEVFDFFIEKMNKGWFFVDTKNNTYYENLDLTKKNLLSREAKNKILLNYSNEFFTNSSKSVDVVLLNMKTSLNSDQKVKDISHTKKYEGKDGEIFTINEHTLSLFTTVRYDKNRLLNSLKGSESTTSYMAYGLILNPKLLSIMGITIPKELEYLFNANKKGMK